MEFISIRRIGWYTHIYFSACHSFLSKRTVARRLLRGQFRALQSSVNLKGGLFQWNRLANHTNSLRRLNTRDCVQLKLLMRACYTTHVVVDGFCWICWMERPLGGISQWGTCGIQLKFLLLFYFPVRICISLQQIRGDSVEKFEVCCFALTFDGILFEYYRIDYNRISHLFDT